MEQKSARSFKQSTPVIENPSAANWSEVVLSATDLHYIRARGGKEGRLWQGQLDGGESSRQHVRDLRSHSGNLKEKLMENISVLLQHRFNCALVKLERRMRPTDPHMQRAPVQQPPPPRSHRDPEKPKWGRES